MLVERGPVRRGDHGTDGGAAVAGVPLGAASGDGVDDLGCGIYPADASVMGVGNEQVARAITRNSHGVRGEGRVGRGAPVSEVACSPTRDGGDDARGQVDSADAAVAYVGEVYGVVSEHGRSISLGGGRGWFEPSVQMETTYGIRNVSASGIATLPSGG